MIDVAARGLVDLPGPEGLPLVGNLLTLQSHAHHHALERWAKDYGPIYRMQIGTQTAVVLSDRDTIRSVLRDRPTGFRRGANLQPIADEVGLDGLFTSEGPRWKAQRKLVQAAFAPKVLRATFPRIREVAQRLLRLWGAAADARRPVDVDADLMRFTIDVTAIVAFGEDVNSLERGPDAFRKHLHHVFPVMFQRVMLPVPYWRYFKLPRDREMDAGLEAVREEVFTFIERARRKLEAEPERAEAPTNMLEALLCARDEEDPTRRLSDEELWANAVGILLAGEDTTAHTITWMLHHVAADPAVQRRWQSEADAALGNAPFVQELADAAAMPYLQGTIQEALRLRMPAPYLLLENLEPVELHDTRLPAGTLVMLLVRSASTREDAFDGATHFDPSRWVLGEQPQRHDSGSSLPFGFGPRICPGRSLGLLEAGVVGSLVAKNFHLDPVDGGKVHEHLSFTMAPREVSMRLRRRRPAASASAG